MVKWKRGRPKNYLRIESNVQFIGPPLRLNKSQIRQRENVEPLVGQAIHGVVEATFEDGFFLSVNVENSDSKLRGVVFKPGRCVLISVHNDVATHLPMIRRNVVHPYASANEARKYTVRESLGTGNRSLVPVPISQPAHPANPSQLSHVTIPTYRVVPIVRIRTVVYVPCQPVVPAQPNRGDKSLIPVPIQYAHHGGNKSTVRDLPESGDRSLVLVPIHYILTAQPAHPANHAQLTPVLVPAPHAQLSRVHVHAPPAQLSRVLVPTPPSQLALPAHPTILARYVVLIVLQLVHQHNGDDGVPIQPVHQAIIRNPVVFVKAAHCQPRSYAD
ncbi:Protein METABOLIC NETWORK MODULATOR 1 [Cardamine amara subsp. amara]|uniref:Protein METABOLIC NETWORK MODULATOR 1 n=1 Tax=Cardamine amara subsp. amara TaxID=228776 RepID=A0ABD1ALI4_CARAN